MAESRAASVLAQVRRDGMAARGQDWSADDEARVQGANPGPVRNPGPPLLRQRALWDDGIIDPAETRLVLALSLSAALNAPIEPTKFGVFRM